MNPAHKKLLFAGGIAAVVIFLLVLLAFDVLHFDFVSFMEIQPSYLPMEKPLPVPPNSIPVEGAAYIPGMGVPTNPVSADDVSIARGKELYQINCMLCHGPQGQGDGPVASFLKNKPANLTSDAVQTKTDGALFMTITNGVTGAMPALNENLLVRERWDVVNYLRTLPSQAAAAPAPTQQAQPTTQPTTAASGASSTATPEAAATASSSQEEVARPSNSGGPGDAINLKGDAAAGATVFNGNCVACHGTDGKQGMSNPGSTDGTVPSLNPIDPTLMNADYKTFATNLDLFMQHGSTPQGPSPALSMPAWGDKNTLTQQQIADAIAYVISLNPVPSSGVPTPTEMAGQDVARPSNAGGPGDALKLQGDATSGAALYATNCAACHGTDGQGNVPNPGSADGTVPALNPIDPTIKNSDLAVFTYNIDLFIEHGSTPEGPSPVFKMPAWGDQGTLKPQQIADVIAYLIKLNGGASQPQATPTP